MARQISLIAHKQHFFLFNGLEWTRKYWSLQHIVINSCGTFNIKCMYVLIWVKIYLLLWIAVKKCWKSIVGYFDK